MSHGPESETDHAGDRHKKTAPDEAVIRGDFRFNYWLRPNNKPKTPPDSTPDKAETTAGPDGPFNTAPKTAVTPTMPPTAAINTLPAAIVSSGVP